MLTPARLLASLVLAAPSAWAALPFAVAPVQYQVTDTAYSSEASVEAVKQSTVAAQVSGRVSAVNFDAGDYVKSGTVIVRLSAQELGAAVAGSQAQVAQAAANLANARANYERQQQLFQQKFISQAALDRATSEFRAAEAAARAARAGVGQSAALSSYTTIVAPFSGVVAARHVEVGETVTPGKPLMTGFDPKDMRVIANIPQYKLAEVKAAPRVSVEIPSLNKWIDATGVTVLPSADSATHTVKVRIELPDNLEGVIPGMFARAHFSVGSARKLVIPASAVVRRSEITAVYVVDKDKVSLRQLRLGTPDARGRVEVLAGLNPGETIALDPVKAGIYAKRAANAAKP
ncbi:MAG: efflux transporter periplasmic adaptor subunit [Hydrogenophilales bacterium 16-64-46]|nr:MAG: efflux transporter periplasmic adaptor subunit [Hydrogenophilales bacterium 12-64-13]OYZ07065.1 MAG: efflux transporter periplasmic adaptor subunit [Hydrogenophilales bacterium 16-64-46]OZA37772.1 MAG: efflux transporter periplasmic adaptor subunit [Hydrogenophilales bacterium 17-64-34]HQS99276.1 efflux RND transporter periplasmic adaptor subunit [Thiobacillus sp.]